MHLQQNDPEHSRHVRNLFLCLHSSFFPNTCVYDSRVSESGDETSGFILLYYLTYNLFLKVGVPRNRVIQNLTESVCAPLQDALPYPLEHGERPGEPLAVSLYASDHKLLGSWLNSRKYR